MRLFDAWRHQYVSSEKDRAVRNELVLAQHLDATLRCKYFTMWRQFPVEMAKFKMKQKRLEELRDKVRSIIPDYDVPT